MAVSHPSFVSIITGGFARHLAAVPFQLAPFARDHVDHPQKSVVAIEHRSWSANDLNPVDQIRIQNKFRPDESTIRKIIVDAVAIDQDQNAAVEIPAIKASDADEGIISIVGHVQSPRTLEDVSQSAVAVLFHLICGDNRDGRRRFGGGLFASRCPCDTEFLEVLQAQGKDIGWFFLGAFSSAQLCSERAE